MIYFEGKPSERSDVDARYGGSSFRLDEVPCVPAQLDFYIVEHARHRGDAYGDPSEFFRFVRGEGQKGCLPGSACAREQRGELRSSSGAVERSFDVGYQLLSTREVRGDFSKAWRERVFEDGHVAYL